MENVNNTFLNLANEIANTIVGKIEKVYEYIHLNDIDEDEHSFYFFNEQEELIQAFHRGLEYSYNDDCCSCELSELNADLITGLFSPIEINRWASISLIRIYKQTDRQIPDFDNFVEFNVN